MNPTMKLHLASSVGLLLGVTPIYAVVEVFVLQMDPLVSLKARLLVAMLAFLGLGFLYASLRQKSKRLFNIGDTADANLAISIHDLLFLIAFNLALTPTLYLVSGASFTEIILGTGFALLMAVFNGPVNGFLVDLAGDLTGCKPSARLPGAIRELAPGRKKLVFTALVGTMIVVLALVYGLLIFR